MGAELLMRSSKTRSRTERLGLPACCSASVAVGTLNIKYCHGPDTPQHCCNHQLINNNQHSISELHQHIDNILINLFLVYVYLLSYFLFVYILFYIFVYVLLSIFVSISSAYPVSEIQYIKDTINNTYHTIYGAEYHYIT